VGFDIVGLGTRNAIPVAGCKDFGAANIGCMPFNDTKVCVGLGEGPGRWCGGWRCGGWIFDSCNLIRFRLRMLEVFDENKIAPTLAFFGCLGVGFFFACWQQHALPLNGLSSHLSLSFIKLLPSITPALVMARLSVVAAFLPAY